MFFYCFYRSVTRADVSDSDSKVIIFFFAFCFRDRVACKKWNGSFQRTRVGNLKKCLLCVCVCVFKIIIFCVLDPLFSWFINIIIICLVWVFGAICVVIVLETAATVCFRTGFFYDS